MSMSRKRTSRSHLSVESEIEELQRLLSKIPDEDVIDRYAFEQRMNAARKELENLGAKERTPESLKLTFRGAPVVGSHGIAANFAGKASSAFADAFAAILADLNLNLRYMGPIPGKMQNTLLVTGTAVGSFGFEYELPFDNEDLFGAQTGADQAVESIKELLKVSVNGSDDEVSDVIEHIHPRAVRKVADFLHVLSINAAWCGMEFRDDYFKYTNAEQLKQSEQRLRAENIVERIEEYYGEFQGVLPQSRNFEFRVSDDESVIRGKLDKRIEEPELLNRDWLHKPIKASFQVIQVGQGRPRFTLLSLADLLEG